MPRIAFIATASLAAAVVIAPATGSAKTISCGTPDTLQVELNTVWPATEGSATAQGPALQRFLGEGASIVILPCHRQGGSSMKPWWTCHFTDDNKSIEVVSGLNPVVEVTFSEGDEAVEEHSLDCEIF